MKRFLLFALLFLHTALCAQERIDTLYYGKSGRIVRNALFADYYRVVLHPEDSTERMMFKEFYQSGALRKEGHLLQLDSLDDSRTSFDGEILTYFKDGKIAEKAHYADGQLQGEFLQYGNNGKPTVQAYYINGELSGICKTYNNDGSFRIVEYDSGKPAHDYYLLSDSNGNTSKFRIADDMPIWESPSVAERVTDYRDGRPWEIYYKNGITVALTCSVIKDYGKWHRIDLMLTNNSTTAIELAPEAALTAYSVDERGTATDLAVWSCEAYMKKVKRGQAWASIAMSFSEGLASAGTSYSTSTTSGYNSSGEYSTYTTTTRTTSVSNAASQQRLAEFDKALQEEKKAKQQDYLKRNTIYPGQSVSGYLHVERIKGERVVFVIDIEGAEYLYEWTFDKEAAYPID